jgi:hypothetical protein
MRNNCASKLGKSCDERNMAEKSNSATEQPLAIPPDDPLRKLATVQTTDQKISHIGVVGDTYTVLLTGKETAGRFV